MLVVVTIISLAVTVAVPLVSGAIRSARLRASTDQLRVSLQAARMIAVSKQSDVAVRIFAHPGNRYEYEDSTGHTRKGRLPPTVCIAGTTAPVLTFHANGSIDAEATTVLTTTGEQAGAVVCDASGAGFELRTSLMGDTHVARIEP
jgi:type II secretory pathway pseudopilin PulG